MRTISMLAVIMVPLLALAQPPPETPPAPPPTSPPPTSPSPPPSEPARTPEELRKICADAMNADKTFAEAIVTTADAKAAERRLAADAQQHAKAAEAVAKNERHVIIAYAAMWLVAVGFVLFLWMRQQALKTELALLRRDLDAATKEGK